MNAMVSGLLPMDEHEENGATESRSESTTPGGVKETKWVVVAEMAGLAPAEIVADRLEIEGIPARAWQEGAGKAFGLTAGLLGTGYVMVPEVYAEEAKEILATPPDEDIFAEAGPENEKF
jgi:hypothetical protein